MKNKGWISYLFQKRMLLILCLGFASGLPLGLSGATLQAWYAYSGSSIVLIGALTLIGQPYVYKYLWAPLIDKWQLPFGRRKGWMIFSQFALIVILCMMAMLNPRDYPYQLLVVAFALAFLSATQDIAVDAYRTEILTPEERGIGTSMAVSGYRVAMLISGGLSMVLADYYGFQLTYFMMAGLMGICLLITYQAKEPDSYAAAPPSVRAACIGPFKEWFSRPQAVVLLLFIILYKFGDAFAGSLTLTFLLQGVGFSLKTIGASYKTVGFIATLSGVFVGGILMIRLGLYRSLLIFGVLQAITNLCFSWLSTVGADIQLMLASIFLENFAGGMGTASFMALIMGLCNRQYTATQFALLSSLSAVARVYIGPFAGQLVQTVGWYEFFIWTVVFSLPGLILLVFLRKTITKYGKGGMQPDPSPAESSSPTENVLANH